MKTRLWVAAGVLALLSACTEEDPKGNGADDKRATWSVGGDVEGLAGTGLTLTNNGGDALALTADGPFTFATRLADKAPFAVAVAADPKRPSQACEVEGGAGVVSGGDVKSVKVRCTTRTFLVGGAVTGLKGTLALELNGAETLTLTADGPFRFTTRLADGASYALAVKTQPTHQSCTIAFGTGRIDAADAGLAVVSCADTGFPLKVAVSGLDGAPVVLESGGESLTVDVDGERAFPSPLQLDAPYDVTVKTHPQFRRCRVEGGKGTMPDGGASVAVQCAYHYDLSTFQSASLVLGQADFVETSPNRGGTPGANTLDSPWGQAVLVKGVLYVADYQNHRVLGYPGVPVANGAAATLVLGQPDFDTADVEYDPTRTTLLYPESVFTDGTRLGVVDYSNNRILLWNVAPTASGTPPDVVVGQPDFVTANSECDAKTLSGPEGAWIAGGRLFVADSGNNRVLVWNRVPTANGAPADVVLGQTSLTQCEANDTDGDGIGDADPSEATLSYPTGVWSDGRRVLVADYGNERLLVWDAVPAANGDAAVRVLGQKDFTTVDYQAPTVRDFSPYYALATGTQLFVVDYFHNRVLVWNQWPTQNHAAADVVLGQADMISEDELDPATDEASARTLSRPGGLALTRGRLLVVDYGNSRILAYDSK
ncbi:MAG: hypothetical protein ACK4N5_02465 [Myxococcales bacterium]